jgi:carbamoyl-phosphate synthase small subunit
VSEALLVLEDGTAFRGQGFGAEGTTFGEIVFNTGMSGYQEVLTDPSYAGQIVTMTSPQIGNYGMNAEDAESDRIQVAGFVVREVSRRVSNWRSEATLQDELAAAGVVGIEGIDTRRLVLHIRTLGAMRAAISTEETDAKALLERVLTQPGMDGADLAKDVSTRERYEAADVVGGSAEVGGDTFRVAAVDFGIKRNILRRLAANGIEATVYPAQTPAEELLSGGYDGVFLSNGPGDPAATRYGIETIKGLLGKTPVFGICLGHQLLGLALGGSSYKMKFGHRGANQPVLNRDTSVVEITSHNHGFAVDASSLESGTDFGRVELTHWNLNDQTLEGLRCLDVPAFSVQYHPEAAPGPHDSRYLFDRFRELMGSS